MPTADDQLVDDVTRIAESVREVVGARAAMVSRVVDDEWLEVMAVVGEPSEGIVQGLRWRRSDLDSLLAERRAARSSPHHHASGGLLRRDPRQRPRDRALHLRPPRAAAGAAARAERPAPRSADAPRDPSTSPPRRRASCELVELYAGQARLALGALRDRGQLAERLRMSHAAHVVLQDAAAADDLPGLLDAVAHSLGDMMRARGAWACAELEPGVHAEGASYPPAVARAARHRRVHAARADDRDEPARGAGRHPSRRRPAGQARRRRGPRAGPARSDRRRHGHARRPARAPRAERRRAGPPTSTRRSSSSAGASARIADQVRGRRRDQRDARAAPAPRREPPRPGRLDHPRPQDAVDGDRAQHRAARVRRAARGGGVSPGGGHPPQRRPAVQPRRRPPGHGARRGGRRRAGRGGPRRDGARRLPPHRDRGDAARGHLRDGQPRGAARRRRRRTPWRGSWPTSSRTP